MIFPKQEMQIEQSQSDELQKEALQLIISLYLQRKKDEDITFLKSNFKSTKKFAEMIRSSWEYGLSQSAVQINKILYGENYQYLPQKYMTLEVCIIKEFVNPYMISSFLLIIICLIYAQSQNIQQMSSSAYIIIIVYIAVSIIRVLLSYFYNYKLSKNSKQKTKKKLYQVVRNGITLEIEECQIVVGDIIQLGLKERVPATGIIISADQIYVKEKNSEQTIKPKQNLESCCRKIQNMSVLDLKLSYQQESLPSPIILRGSELLKEATCSIIVISVTEENLLESFGLKCKDSFTCQKYDKWVSKLTTKWSNWSIYLITLVIVMLTFCKLTDLNLQKKSEETIIHVIFQIFSQISILIFILNPINIQIYLNNIFINLITNLKIIENYQQFFIADRIICNQRCIVEHDEIQVLQIALCQNQDLITPTQTENTNMITHQLITEICSIFGLNTQQSNPPKQRQRMNKIVHLNKKTKKIISVFSHSKIGNKIAKDIIKQLTKINYEKSFHEHRRNSSPNTLQIHKFDWNKQKYGSLHLLKLPTRKSQQQYQDENMKEILHNKKVLETKKVVDNLIGLKQDSTRTYYFIPYQMDSLENVKYIVVNGQIQIFDQNHKERMVMLAKKMKVLYGLLSVIVGYNEGAYQNQPLSTLVCILGVTIKDNNKIIKLLKKMEPIGIKSLIFITQSKQKIRQTTQNEQKDIYEQYKYRNWLAANDLNAIYNMQFIKKNLKRLICKKCWIANCDCKQKIQELSNIQPFIQISNKIKIGYNVTETSLNVLECAFKQLQYQPICINQNNKSATDIIQSIFLCLKFLQNLKRSVILYYAVTIVYFLVPILFWIYNQNVIKTIHIGISQAFLLSSFALGMLCQIKVPLQKLDLVKKNPKIIKKQQSLFIYVSCLMIIAATKLFSCFCYLIPQFRDRFDSLMQKYQIDPFQCKYGQNLSTIAFIDNIFCQTVETGIQYSRISTIITLYIYFSLWLLMVIFHHNLRSVWSFICYIGTLGIYICFMEFAPQLIHTYSQGLSYQHLLLIGVSTIVTLLLSYIISYIIGKFPITQYFTQQLQTKILFKQENENHFSRKLKLYNKQKNLQRIDTTDKQNLFNSI